MVIFVTRFLILIMYSQNPLVLAVLSILKNNKEALGLYELMQALQHQGFTLVENADELSYEIYMFRKNFVVMNALYQLQHELAESGCHLYISSLKISLCDTSEEAARALSSQACDPQAEQNLASYYLDWDNYNSTDQAAVEALLGNFWKQFSEYTNGINSDEKRLDALRILELESDASWQHIQQRYRKKIAVYHPDKGGDSSKFIEIREAFQFLKFVCQKNQ